VREIRTITYEAFDGTPFPTKGECRAYERKRVADQLIGLTRQQIEGALAYSEEQRSLADALEYTAYRISVARKALGIRHNERRREPDPRQGTLFEENDT
jgi:hypothetical protein